MQLRKLGKSNINVTPIIMGTWQAGKEQWVGIQDQEIIAAVHTACAAGINAFDTAEAYGGGYSERILGKALKGRRDKVVVMSKVFSTHLAYDQLIKACEQTLRNLDSDYLDLYQIHWPSGLFGSKRVPIAETMRALCHLKEIGKIRAIGVSNFSKVELEEAVQYGPIDSMQPPYSLFWRHIEKELTPFCRANNISILAYSPLAQGLLSGKFKAGHQFAKGDIRANNKLFHANHFPRVLEALEKLRPIAEKKGVSLAQLALAWVISHEQTFAIAGARNSQQISDNAKAADIKLTPAEIAEMNVISSKVIEPFKDDPIQWFLGN